MKLPLKGFTVLEFSQYMAGPYAGLRLADLGARVIKIERPVYGDACRQLVTKNMKAGDDSVLFHTVNRNKESFQANLKDPNDIELIKKLLPQVDVITHNFRPGIMQRLGLDYETVRVINPKLIYAEVSGYGDKGPWKSKPGQDLLAQSMSGLTWLSGNGSDDPIPFGAAVADMVCGSNLAQAIMAALLRRRKTGQGAKVEVSLMESILDFQFEGLTAYLNADSNPHSTLPKRSDVANAHAYLGAPYGIYATKDSYIAIAMGSIETLSELLELPELLSFADNNRYYVERNAAKTLIAEHLITQTTDHWLRKLEAQEYWCSNVLTYNQLVETEGYKALEMEMTITRNEDISLLTTRCPIRLNGNKIYHPNAAPILGQDTASISKEFSL
jgi:crotonobetainyl-CoA:carnitine CoA-transferase CaiB-like acyl-CoA transferase